MKNSFDNMMLGNGVKESMDKLGIEINKENEKAELTPKEALKQLWDNSMHRDDLIGRNVEEANEEDLVCYNIVLQALENCNVR
jgi:hypothetical protein